MHVRYKNMIKWKILVLDDLNSTATVFGSFFDLLIEGFYDYRISNNRLIKLVDS